MGPVLIFDKSFLESLTVNESVWLDHFFLCNITPLFYVETLADLEKDYKSGKVPRVSQEIVKEIAKKTPIINPCPSIHHHRIVVGELLGQEVDVVHRRIQRSGGKYVKYADGSIGIDFKQFPEEAALHRWKAGQFEEIERDIAKEWREALSAVNFDETVSLIDSKVPQNAKIPNLQALKDFVDNFVKARYKQFIYFALEILEVSEKARKPIIKRWRENNWQTFEEFSPYAAHVLKTNLFFYIGISRGLIGKERASSNMVDISYLYYLPFCHVFVSNDRLHKRITPLFVESDQSFIKGEELKAALRKINGYYAGLPQEVKKLGPFGFAHYPPIEIDNLVADLHDKHLKPWRERAKESTPGLPKQDRRLLNKLKKRKRTQTAYTGPPISSDEVDSMIVSRRVPVVRGDWNMVPPEVLEKKRG
ncbi:hypothetical protein KKH23_07575 [Patescibacteria group bacterium]|nr:hypothetical protein [Patescibacteria group bacterium]MBU0777022.1 hypothetical protein [Patescibacteria group bacterium]MBU0847037.1 hypothetical protein [Patescibacteria group bacterium]MBU0923093.1 hypothetical protein [Patescibacteria group bacterium]MBU1066575.1 hypothetical protein [Patescibacteria group bacterium]